MPNILPSQIKTFKEALKWLLDRTDYKSPKVRVLAELYQGSNPLYPSTHEFSEVEGGVCTGMALEWIKKNKLGGGGDEFRKMAKTNWESFAISQISYAHQKRLLRPEVEKNRMRGEEVGRRIGELTPDVEYAEEEGLFADIKHFISPPKPKKELEDQIKKLHSQSLRVKQRAARTLEKSDAILARGVFGTDGTFNFSRVTGDVELLQIGSNIQYDQGKFPAYYLISLHGRSDNGHSIAVHAAYRPRLLDANGCELQFESMTTFYAFLADYWQIYQRTGYSTSRATIYRFNIRIAPTARQNAVALGIHKERTKLVHAELTGQG